MSRGGRGLCVISSIARNLLLARKEVPLAAFRVTKREARCDSRRACTKTFLAQPPSLLTFGILKLYLYQLFKGRGVEQPGSSSGS